MITVHVGGLGNTGSANASIQCNTRLAQGNGVLLSDTRADADDLPVATREGKVGSDIGKGG